MQPLKRFVLGFLNGFKKAQNDCVEIKGQKLNFVEYKPNYVSNEDIEHYGFPECEESEVSVITSKGYYDIKGIFYPY